MTNFLYSLTLILQVWFHKLYSLSIKTACKKCFLVCPSGYLDGDTGTITSPGYPAILRQKYYCRWTIHVKEDRRITFKIEDADLASVRKFSIFEGSYEHIPIAEKPIIQSGATYETTSNVADIVFWQGSTREGGKFKLTYTSDKPTCNNTFENCYKDFQTD